MRARSDDTVRPFDLIVLVADLDMEHVVDTLLTARRKSLKIREVSYRIIRHPQRDAGVFREAPEFLRNYRGRAEHALVMLDHMGSGQEQRDAEALAQDLEARLTQIGWLRDQVAAIVMDPELETWVWASPYRMAQVIGIPKTELLAILDRTPRRPDGKPTQPKEVLQAALRLGGRPFSARIFQELARQIGLRRCRDRWFRQLERRFQQWFPPP